MAEALGHEVFLHVGTPKSGTTYLQGELAHNRALLRRHGYLYPGAKHAAHFMAALDLRERGFGGHHYRESEGAWQATADEVLAYDGPALISHEILGGASTEVIRRAVDSFPGRRVRVVLTCRDLGRQIPAAWQENVKNRSTVPYAAFVRRTFAKWEGAETSSAGIWTAQNLAALARRWGEVVGPENVILVTVPPSGAAPGELWRRFAEAVGLPDADYQPSTQTSNPSLGTAETELLRRLTARLPEDLPWPTHSRLIKRRLAQKELVEHRTAGMLTVPADHRARTVEVADEMVTSLRQGGYRVVGDLADLTPAIREDGTVPADLTDSQLLDLALDVMVPLALREPRRRRGRRPETAPNGATASRLRLLAARVRRRLGR
ncbi:hypothetical protein [Nocardioides coralli]|uniref:hypothetical protein n=1 Tax=Nocardioides coralli TaxID=2872154 RepID=UPI001CA422B2|nr:hypothetical protein [Nocardioides coralli]QZY30049.1 hypothetical protein K6T13_05020 [Nocardioides coralli]